MDSKTKRDDREEEDDPSSFLLRLFSFLFFFFSLFITTHSALRCDDVFSRAESESFGCREEEREQLL
jgi:hypothetical protein